MLCEDAVYVEAMIGNVTHQVAKAVGNQMPFIMLEYTLMNILFETCVTDTFVHHHGFSIDVSLSGLYHFTNEGAIFHIGFLYLNPRSTRLNFWLHSWPTITNGHNRI